MFRGYVNFRECTPLKTNIRIEHPPFEDVFPIENWDFPACHVSFRCARRSFMPWNNEKDPVFPRRVCRKMFFLDSGTMKERTTSTSWESQS